MLRLIVSGLIALSFYGADGSYLRADKDLSLYLNLAQKIEGAAFTSYPLNDGAGNNSVCSGTLINEGTLLTAAHCVPNGLNIKLEDFKTIKIGTGRDRNDPNAIHRGVKHVRVHPKYVEKNKGAGSYDIAVILLDTPIYDSPFGYGKRSTTAPQIGDKVMGYGFGTLAKIGDEAQPNDKLVAYQTYIDSLSLSDFKVRADRGALQGLDGISAPGDSGGGVVNSSFQLIGIHSSKDEVGISLSTPSTAVNLLNYEIINFLASLPVYTTVKWVGDGNVSNPLNWSKGELIENHSQRAPKLKYDDQEWHYDIEPIVEAKTMIVDKYLHVDRIILDHKDAKFIVNEGEKANFDYGIDLRQGSIDIKGQMDAGFLKVGDGTTFKSGEFNLYDGGYVTLEGGTVNAKFAMEGGVLEGRGRLTGKATGGSIFPKDGNIYITGEYNRRDDKSDVVGVRFFPGGKSEYLSVGALNLSKLSFKFFFPNLGISPGVKYTVMESGNGFGSLAEKDSLTIDSQYVLWEGKKAFTTGVNSLSITPTKFELKKQTASDRRPQVHAGLASMAPFLSKSFTDYANAMPADLFLRSLDTFLDSRIQTQLYSTLMNHLMHDEHTHERTILFLEKSRSSVDLASFAFHGKNSFKGDDVPVPSKDTSPVSFFISGDVYETSTRYATKGLTLGWDYAHQNTLSGVSFHFKNEAQDLSPQQEYHLEFYNATRSGFLFWDQHLDYGLYSRDARLSNIWGTWENSPKMNQGRIQSRAGVYSSNKTHFGAAYVGLMGAHANLDAYTSKGSLGLDMQTDPTSFYMLSGLVGGEGKVRVHMNDILVEPAVRLGAMVSFYDNWKMPQNRFYGSAQGFRMNDALLPKTSLLLDGAVRIYIPKGIMLKTGGQVSGLQGDLSSKLFLSVSAVF